MMKLQAQSFYTWLALRATIALSTQSFGPAGRDLSWVSQFNRTLCSGCRDRSTSLTCPQQASTSIGWIRVLVAQSLLWVPDGR
jgi:hypothetical protein